MSFEIEGMSDDEITSLVKQSQPAKKSKRIDLTVRTYQTWWRIHHSFAKCDYCPRERMTAALTDNSRICRFCFLEGKGE